MKKLILFFFGCFVSSLAWSQWTTLGSNIYYNSGYVGIGTTNPLVKLAISGDLNTERMSITSSSDPVIQLYHQNGTTSLPSAIVAGNYLGYYELGGFDGLQNQRAAWITGIASQNWTGSARGASIVFSTTPDNSTTITERMRIDQFGNIGIGTTNTGTNKLAVEGNIAARKVIVTVANPFPDYVFEPSYHLPSLDSVAQFIQANHHLSEMPSADSVAKNGLDLGGNQAAMLKEIEELTLYVIDLNKKNELLQQQVGELKVLVDKNVKSK